MTTDQSLQQLFSRRAWHKNTGIRESTARIYRKRFRENKLELETKIKILQMAGYKLKRDMDWEADHTFIRAVLTDKLYRNKVFWSYDPTHKESLPDEMLIERVLLHLDLEDITSLFTLFRRSEIKKIWLEKMVSQEPMYHALNRLYAFLYFGIKNPDRYIRRFLNKKQKEFHERIDFLYGKGL
jgi:hypothetical protein